MKNYIIGFIAVAALVLGGIGVSKNSKVGLNGQQGVQGESGTQGVKGDRGERGQQGVQGERGAKGESGAIGMPGKLGAVSGPDLYNNLNVNGNLTTGGGTGIATSTTAATYTFVKKDLEPYSMIDLMENTGAASFTLPATSTMMDMLRGVGASRTWLIHNATSSSGITLTLVAGAGMDLVAVTANDDVIDPGEYTQLTCIQIPYRSADNENIVCIVDELANAD